ncbi:unnamed protein product, partial [Polarella glacialis]
DVDLSRAEANAQEAAAEESGRIAPATFTEWLQGAPPEELRAALKSLLSAGNGEALSQMKSVLE